MSENNSVPETSISGKMRLVLEIPANIIVTLARAAELKGLTADQYVCSLIQAESEKTEPSPNELEAFASSLYNYILLNCGRSVTFQEAFNSFVLVRKVPDFTPNELASIKLLFNNICVESGALRCSGDKDPVITRRNIKV